MQKSSLVLTLSLLMLFNAGISYGLVPVKVVAGQIFINSSHSAADKNSLVAVTDSLDKTLKKHPDDTTSLFFRALLYLHFNAMMAKPYQRAQGALENLTVAKDMIDRAARLKMQSLNFRILRVQVYKELAYRFSGDESWMFTAGQIVERKALFNKYKALANNYYDELSIIDKKNAYDYGKLKVSYKYPIK